MDRVIEIRRKTRETDVLLFLLIAGQGQVSVQTGLGYFDHIMTLLAFWGGFDLQVQAKGDLEVDAHHLVEDIGLCLGEALDKARAQGQDLSRVGWARVPMDEALTEVVVDLSGRAYLVYNEQVLPDQIFGQEKDLWREFFKSVAFRARMNLHLNFLYGQNGHHLIESAAKGLGLALRQAFCKRGQGVLSTKGSLDQ